MQFVIRVYGLLVDANDRVLVSDEKIRGKYYTKFPGGGLEFGEGTRDCLIREFKEETGLEITVRDHFYTTDFYQVSAFSPEHQIVSIYYMVSSPDLSELRTCENKYSFSKEQLANPSDCEVFRWVAISELTADEVTLPIDKAVVNLLRQSRNKSGTGL